MSPPVSTTQSPAFGPFGPLLILSIAFLVLLIYQFIIMQSTGSSLARQIDQQQALVIQSRNTQSRASQLLLDLLVVAEEDEQARAIIQKHGIQRQINAPGSTQGGLPSSPSQPPSN